MENIQAKLGITSTDMVALPNDHPKAIRVDLGCGLRKRSDFPFIGIDRQPGLGADIVRDVEKGLPFCDNCIDFIYASHLMEHINDLAFLMDEIWRVLKREGILELICPRWNSKMAYFDPTHKRFIHPFLWNWWDPKHNDPRQYGFKAQFRVLANDIKGEGVFTTMMAVK